MKPKIIIGILLSVLIFLSISSFVYFKFFTKSEIVIGTTLDLSGYSANIGTEIVKGLKLRIQQANNTNEIGNKEYEIKLVALDDKFTPHQAQKNVQKLLDYYKTDILLHPFGSFPFRAYFPMVQTGQVLVLFPDATASLFRDPYLTHIAHWLASAYEEGHALAKYTIQELKPERIAVLYQVEPYSLDVFEGIESTFEKYNLRQDLDWIATTIRTSGSDIKDAAELVTDFNPDVIIFATFSRLTQNFIDHVKTENLADTKLLIVPSPISLIKYLREEKKLQLITANLIPNIKTSNLKIATEYREAIKQNGYEINPYSFMGYLSADIFIEIVKKTGLPITKEKIISFIEKIKDYNHKGLKLNFNHQTKELTKNIWIDTGQKEWIPFIKSD